MSNKNKKILIVDDEPLLIEIISDYLEGYQVISAKNGKEGLEKVESEKPDLVISDINMPVMTGLKMLECLREKGINTPVIVVTGYGDKEKMRDAWRLGAYDFLDKPIDPDNLIHVVDAALKYGIDFNESKKQPNFVEKALYRTFTVSLEASLFQQFETYCIDHNQSMNGYIESHVHELIKKQNKVA